MNESILIVDDDRDICELLRRRLAKAGYKPLCAFTGQEGLTLVKNKKVDCVLLDLKLPDMDGMDVLDKMKEASYGAPVIVITMHADLRKAVAAIKRGAFDFLAKSDFQENPEALEIPIKQALNMVSMQQELDIMRRQTQSTGAPLLLGNSAPIRAVLQTLDKVAQSRATTVLITGETGTGKELAARIIHYRSARSSKPLVVVNCTALHEQLLESELFGHERGAFTDAKEAKKGLLEIAHGGSILLDEIGDMDYRLQAKILRVLETGIFRRVGGTQEIAVDVRIIASTNKNLEEEIKKERFRKDLFYRLQVVPVHMPPLREHKEDVLLLAHHFLTQYAVEMRRPAPQLTPEVERALVAYDWPGNVRELRNLMERLVIMSTKDTVEINDLPEPIRVGANVYVPLLPAVPEGPATFQQVKQETIRRFEKEYLESLLRRNGGNISKSAKEAGLERRNFQRLLKKHGIVPMEFRT